MKYKLTAATIIICILVTFFPAGALAADAISTSGTYDIGNYGNDSTVSISPGLSVTLTNTTGTTYTNMRINCGAGTSLTISGIKIDNSASSGACALSFSGSGNRLIMVGDSALNSGSGEPGIRVESGTALTISGTGSVEAAGGNMAAGIGAGQGDSDGAITITGGDIFAQKGTGAPYDIGSGTSVTSGTLTISGDAAVFIKNDKATMPTTNTHKLAVINSLSDSRLSGIALPNTWAAPLYAHLNTGALDLAISGPVSVVPGGTYTYTVTVTDNAAAILGTVTCGGAFTGAIVTFDKDSGGGLSEYITATATITVTVSSSASSGDIGTISVKGQESFSDGTRVDARFFSGSRNASVLMNFVTYQTHVQNIGWQSWVSDGAIAGTTGQALRLESIRIQLNNAVGGIEYCTHVQNIGWMDWVSNGALSGTTGQSLRLEAIKIRLTGAAATQYDIYYRVHAQNFGWMDWAKNGSSAGTAGYSYRLEAIQIVLVEKGGSAPGSTTTPFRDNTQPSPSTNSVKYQTHVQNIGWQDWKYDGDAAGTWGQSLRLEGIHIEIQGVSNAIEYRTHVQNIGWQDWVSDGEMAGTTGLSYRLEAIDIRLTGTMATQYDIYYRVHAQNFGWMDWAKNGASAGTAGYSYRLEAIQIVLVSKGGAAPGSTAVPFRSR